MFDTKTKHEEHYGGEIPIVQGFEADGDAPLLSNDYAEEAQQNYILDTSGTTTAGTYFNGRKGEVQPDKYRDLHFAVAFLVQLSIVGYHSQKNILDNYFPTSSVGFIFFLFVIVVFATVLSSLAMIFMVNHSRNMIKASIFFVIGSNSLIFMFGFIFTSGGLGLVGLISAAYTIYWAYTAWSRIPFAAANLHTAVTAVRTYQKGLCTVAFFHIALSFLWILCWSIAFGETMFFLHDSHMVKFLCLVSYYWTSRVLENTVQVTTVGVIGTWWFEPEEQTLDHSSYLSTPVLGSLKRATTYSFGSICYGSLLSAFCQVLRSLHRRLRNHDDMSALGCIIQCLLACIEEIIDYLNKYAFVYVGLYGYSYLEAGKNVLQLFTNRGWSVIYTDTLCEFLLFMISCGIGLLTGLFVYFLTEQVEIIKPVLTGRKGEDVFFLMVSGIIVGFVTSSIIMSIVSSAVNTIIVCFAESPAEFEENHPELSRLLKEAWVERYPELNDTE